MLQKSLYASYALGMKALGFERSISSFIDALNLDYPNDAEIIDVGCGTGIIGLTLMNNHSMSTLIATDLNEDLLKQTRSNADERGINNSRIILGVSDISDPKKAWSVEEQDKQLTINEFDIVSTGAAIGYSQNQEDSIKILLNMVKPKGYFINIEMNEHFFGRATSKKYHYPIMPLLNMKKIIEDYGFTVTSIPVNKFPAQLTRTCLIARRKES